MKEATRKAVDIMIHRSLEQCLYNRMLSIFCIYLMIKNINDIQRHMVLKMTNYLLTSHRNTKSHTHK